MIKVMFVCHGNICRSPMAEFVLKDMVKRRGMSSEFVINSSATSDEEFGNGIHRGTRRKLTEMGIPFREHFATPLSSGDAAEYDYFIGMDSANIRNMKRILGAGAEGKIYKMLDFTDHSRDVADPWYTGDFDLTYQDITEGCEGFLAMLSENRR